MNLEDSAFLKTDRFMKVYFVELDDDKRERVITGVVKRGAVDIQSNHEEVEAFDGFVVQSWDIPTKVTIEFEFQKQPNGSYFTVENFWKEDEE